MDKNMLESKVKSAIFGVAAGDALGVPVEFKNREKLRKDPVTDMIGGGTYRMPAGTWSDDTSMALAALDVLCDDVDYEKIMTAFCKWRFEGKYTSTDECFDIGITTANALQRFRNGTHPLECGGADERDNGNGSLMRIVPFALYYKFSADDPEEMRTGIYNASALTHRHMRSKIGCYIYSYIAAALIDDPDLSSRAAKISFFNDKLGEIQDSFAFRGKTDEIVELAAYERIFEPDFADLSESEISSGGYVVHSLEAAFWCILNTDSYAECVLKAVNLGGDTDTTAAIAGGLAGLIYGYDNIPEKWLNVLKKHDKIAELCEKFADSLCSERTAPVRRKDDTLRYKAVCGAIIGDIVGSIYERNNIKSTDFPLFSEYSTFTDDTVMTIATLHALQTSDSAEDLHKAAAESYKAFGRRYPDAGYGYMFRKWLSSDEYYAYNSFGNGACMRVSPCLYAGDLIRQLSCAKTVTAVTHDHPNALMWVERYIRLLNVARSGKEAFDNALLSQPYCPAHDVEWYRENSTFDATCDGTMPVVLTSVLESDSFEDCIRNAVSTGGDSDTIACIAGALAAVIFGIPDKIWNKAKTYLPDEFLEILRKDIS